MKRTIMITGATSGFGKAIAIKFAENGFDIIITGRRNRIPQIPNRFKNKYKNQNYVSI